jgi:hypothetical protein
LQTLVNINKNKLSELNQIAKNKNLKGISQMKKPELSNIIIKDDIQHFNKTNKTNKYINKLHRGEPP